MDLLQLVSDLFTDYTLRTVATGTAILGLVSGALGAFAFLRRQSLVGDAISHAALPGVVLAFMLTGLKGPLVLMAGAAVAGIAGVLLVIAITRLTRLKQDSALGIILSAFFGFGLMLLTFLQRNPDARQAGLNHFLFGQAATLLERDVVVMGLFGAAALALTLLFWKEFKLLSFDRDFVRQSLRVSYARPRDSSHTLVGCGHRDWLTGSWRDSDERHDRGAAAAARQWTDRLGVMVFLSALFGADAGVVGTLISSLGTGLSTGPVIVLCVSVIALVSLLLAPGRGIVWTWRHNPRRMRSAQWKGEGVGER